MARLGRAWRAVGDLSWGQRLLLCQAGLLLPLAALSLRLLGFRRALALLLPREGDGSAGRADLTAAQAVARIVYGAANWSPVRATCLTRSLVLTRLLRGQGLTAELRIGVGKPEGRFEAHAWVEHGGVTLADPGSVADRYSAFDETVFTKGA